MSSCRREERTRGGIARTDTAYTSFVDEEINEDQYVCVRAWNRSYHRHRRRRLAPPSSLAAAPPAPDVLVELAEPAGGWLTAR